jgi:hypothetical protein
MRAEANQFMGKKRAAATGNKPYDWARRGVSWNKLLEKIESILDRLTPGTKWSRDSWDTPELRMQWVSDDLGRAIQILISPDSKKLIISGSAWKDSGQIRHWKTQKLETISIPRMPQELDVSTFSEQLKHSKETVLSWTIDDLVRKDPLPPNRQQCRKSTAL